MYSNKESKKVYIALTEEHIKIRAEAEQKNAIVRASYKRDADNNAYNQMLEELNIPLVTERRFKR